MAKRDYYETLGLQRDAGEGDIKKAYRRLAMECHPDRNPGDEAAEQRFKELSEAYSILKDDEKRAAYDQFGHAAVDGSGGQHPGAGFGGFSASSFADVFEDLFGDFVGRRNDGGARQGADLRYNMEISLEDAYSGKTTNIRTTAAAACDECGGSGAEKGTTPVACSSCQGVGKVRAQQGFFTIERTCPTCQGAGRMVKSVCRNCGGGGRISKEKQLQVNIPKGVEDEMRIRLTGEGEAGIRGGPPGDLYIFLRLAPHTLFERIGAELHCQVPLPMTQAVLGGTLEVPTIGGGRARVTIPEGTQSGQQFRLRGKGMPVMRTSGTGDMIVQTKVETPINLNDKQKDLFKEFANSEGTSNSPEAEGFFAKVKELWDDIKD